MVGTKPSCDTLFFVEPLCAFRFVKFEMTFSTPVVQSVLLFSLSLTRNLIFFSYILCQDTQPYTCLLVTPYAACTAGYYCTRGSDSGESAICPAGHYCPASTPSSTAYSCPAGTYSSSTGLVDSTGCMACTLGSYCPEGSIAPTSCVVGTYNPYTSAMEESACLACIAGWACPSSGMYEMTTR